MGDLLRNRQLRHFPARRTTYHRGAAGAEVTVRIRLAACFRQSTQQMVNGATNRADKAKHMRPLSRSNRRSIEMSARPGAVSTAHLQVVAALLDSPWVNRNLK